jgi:hypothetical protein
MLIPNSFVFPDGSEAGLKACNIAFRLTDMDKWVREAAAHQEKVDGIPHGPDGDYRPPQPILGPLGQSEGSMMRFCEQATVVLTDFGRCEFHFIRLHDHKSALMNFHAFRSL